MTQTSSPNSPPQSDPLWGAAIVSALLHAGALAAAVLAWPALAPPVIVTSDAIPVDLVTIADETNITPQEMAPEPTPEPPPEVAAAEESVPEEPPPPPPPEQDGFAVEEKVEPPKPEPKMAMAEPPPRPEKKKEKKEEKKKNEFDIDRIAGLIEKMDKAPPAAETREGAKPSAQQSVRGAGARTAMTATEVDALRAQLRKCWNVPVGAPDPAALVFRLRIFLNPDGSVATPPELVDQAGLSDPYFRAAVDSAKRAVLMCSPFQLPADKYEAWNDITITFDPTRMAGY